MINRDMETVSVITYTNTKNSMGQPMTTQSSTRDIQACIKLRSEKMVDNPRYDNCEYIAITNDKAVSVGNAISYNGKTFDIMYIIPSRRYNQLLLRKFD